MQTVEEYWYEVRGNIQHLELDIQHGNVVCDDDVEQWLDSVADDAGSHRSRIIDIIAHTNNIEAVEGVEAYPPDHHVWSALEVIAVCAYRADLYEEWERHEHRLALWRHECEGCGQELRHWHGGVWDCPQRELCCTCLAYYCPATVNSEDGGSQCPGCSDIQKDGE